MLKRCNSLLSRIFLKLIRDNNSEGAIMESWQKSHLHVTYSKVNDAKESNEETSKKPVVLLFGWMGASDRYLKVYSDMYEEKGYPTVRLTVSPIIVLFRNNDMCKYSDKLLKILDEPEFKGRPVIVHLFSNGGAFQYEFFSKALREDQSKRELVKGVIFDSGPAPWTLYNSFTVCAVILGAYVSNRFLLYPLTFLFISCAAFFTGVRKIQKDVLKMNVPLHDPYNNLKNQENICPQLFIYSKADPLVPYRALEAFIELRKAKGVDVTSKLYETTQHVKHYPADKLEYCRTVFKFLNRVIKK